jgi:hypothetical protein
METSAWMGYLIASHQSSREAASTDRTPAINREPQEYLLLFHHGAAVLSPIWVLTADGAVIVDEGFDRGRLFDELNTTVNLNPLSIEVVREHAYGALTFARGVLSFGPLWIGCDRD